MADTPTNALDELMDKDPLLLTKEDLDSIITFHRKKRAERETGGAGARRASKDTGASATLASLVEKMKTNAPNAGIIANVVKRRI